MFGPGEAGDATGQALREVAGAELYRRNAFRITGLSTYADRRAVRRRKQQVTPALQVGADVDLGHDLAVGPEEVRAAFDRLLDDPRRRLVDELFWLWHTPDASCPCPAGLHREHDAAVRAHSAALDLEAEGPSPGPELDELWTRAAEQWQAVLRRAVFWEHVRHRLTALDDRQLDERAVDTLRKELRAALVRPLIELTARGGDQQGRRAGLARRWPAPAFLVDEQLEEVAAPLYEAANTALNDASRRYDEDEPDRAAGAVLDSVLPELRRLDALVPRDRHRRTASLYDDTAILLNNCALAVMRDEGGAGEPRARSWLKSARELTSDQETRELIEENERSLYQITVAYELARSSGSYAPRPRDARPYVPAPRRRRGLRTAFWVAVLVGTGLLIGQCSGAFDGTSVPAASETVYEGETGRGTVFSEAKADNLPVGTCVTSLASWESGGGTVSTVPCDEPHWGEVLGYVPLGEVPSPYPGDDQVRATAAFECELLRQRQDGLTEDRYQVRFLVPGEKDWNTGGGAYENYAPCVLSRAGDVPYADRRVQDPPPRKDEPPVRMDLFAANIADNPPVGTCVQAKQAWDRSPHQVDIVRCARPHWAEIAGYVELYEPGQKWPGDKKVYAEAEEACTGVMFQMRTGPGHVLNITWPGRDWWDSSTQKIYAVCLVNRDDDQAFTGGLR
ncbi:hypothetical protein HCN51_48690 [Nonomuraea sp. FMUSA5-5]|uniref:Septum formation-related domain-containing protein n=1 Tax=Nonomuraea composti TaxID=2720023 RepID=A0ABX1BLE1_9ACTN|nr:septum formation family protein [Nonomuraea sp. FMUSA5-5]NJP97220.1 hypothetical protein [Nonomuraea sp. FMUSA5-5]